MTDQAKQKVKYWLFGLFTGCAVAAPITAFACKNIYDKKIEEAEEEAETRGMNAMAEYAAKQQIEGEVITERDENGKPIAGRYPFGKDDKLTEEDYAAPDDEDINNYDVSIDDEEATEKARERTEAHERYLDMLDKYNGNDVLEPRVISADEFENEQYMQKAYINWYEEDDVFEEDLRPVDDPFLTFGVTSGRELFKNAELRDDPDICYVRSEKHTTDYEISRIHGSYARMVGGEPNIGETDT